MSKPKHRYAMFMALGFIPCIIWRQQNGIWIHRIRPFLNRDCFNLDHAEYCDIGDVVELECCKTWFHLGRAGVVAEFKTKVEANEYAVLYELEHGVGDAN